MVNVTVEFPPHDGTQTRPYARPDGATVADLKSDISADGGAPIAFQGQAAGNLTVRLGGNIVDDGTALVDQSTYEVDLAIAYDDYEQRGGFQAPPPSPPGDGDGDGGGGDGGGRAPTAAALTAAVWAYFVVNGVQQGAPQTYSAANSVAALKEQIAADPNSPLGSITSAEIAVHDGNNWLGDSDSITDGAAYTVQRSE